MNTLAQWTRTLARTVIELGGAGPPGLWASGVLAGFLEEAMLERR